MSRPRCDDLVYIFQCAVSNKDLTSERTSTKEPSGDALLGMLVLLVIAKTHHRDGNVPEDIVRGMIHRADAGCLGCCSLGASCFLHFFHALFEGDESTVTRQATDRLEGSAPSITLPYFWTHPPLGWGSGAERCDGATD